jgi:hypothetical protein
MLRAASGGFMRPKRRRPPYRERIRATAYDWLLGFASFGFAVSMVPADADRSEETEVLDWLERTWDEQETAARKARHGRRAL